MTFVGVLIFLCLNWLTVYISFIPIGWICSSNNNNNRYIWKYQNLRQIQDTMRIKMAIIKLCQMNIDLFENTSEYNRSWGGKFKTIHITLPSSIFLLIKMACYFLYYFMHRSSKKILCHQFHNYYNCIFISFFQAMLIKSRWQ